LILRSPLYTNLTLALLNSFLLGFTIDNGLNPPELGILRIPLSLFIVARLMVVMPELPIGVDKDEL
jgi:hypothetical protein